MKKIFFSLILASWLLSLSLAAPVYAGKTLEGKVIIGEDFTLTSGETIDGDLVVISGSAVVEAGALITGNVVVMGGSADLAGRVNQNVTVMGGNVTLRASAEVDQQLAVLGGSITREEGAQVKGGESHSFGFGGNSNEDRVAPGRITARSAFSPLAALIQSFFQAVAIIVVISGLALLTGALWPESTTRVSAAIGTAPAVSGLLGLLTLIAVPILLALVAITFCLAPVSLLGAIVYVAALLFGWVAFGLLVGNRLAAAFRWNLPPAGSALAGTFIVTTVAVPLWFIPGVQCLGIPLDTIFACLGLGGVVLTRFGSTPYVAGLRPPAPPPPPEPPRPPAPPDITRFGREPEAPAAPEVAHPPAASEPSAEPPAVPEVRDPPAASRPPAEPPTPAG